MFIDKIEFERLEEVPEALSRWTIRVVIAGSGFEERAAPVIATVGGQSVELLLPLIVEEGAVGGVQGFLRSQPADGDEVAVGHLDSPLAGTGIEFTEDQLL